MDKRFIGVDVSKESVDIAVHGAAAVRRLDNTVEAVAGWARAASMPPASSCQGAD